MGRIALKRITQTSAFRKVAMGTWRTVGDPTVYALLDVDMTKSLEFIRHSNEKSGVKLTPSHLVGAAVAHALTKRPELNSLIRGSHIYQRKHVDLFFQVNIPSQDSDTGKADLSGCVIAQAETLTCLDIAKRLKEKAQLARDRKDKEISKQMGIIKMIPWCLIRFFLNLTSFLIYTLNLDLRGLGLPKDPFGSVMITNIGSFGVDLALAPLVPYSRVPFLIAVGTVKERPMVVSGQVMPRQVMSLGVTFDHRLVDGVHMAEMNHTFLKCFEDPEKYFSNAPNQLGSESRPS